MTRTLYSWLLRLAFPYVCLRLFLRGLKNRDYWRRLPERFGFAPRAGAPGAVWVHAVSVGEVRAAAPLVRALRAHHAVAMTAMTPTGSATVRGLFGAQVAHSYVPYDYPGAVNRFLDRVRPSLVVILEKELWPNLVHFARARGIPVCVANAQLGEASLRGWKRLGKLAGATFGAVNVYAAQSEADAQRLIAAGARPETVHVVGSIKFDLALPDDLPARAQALRRTLGTGRPVWLAASTHEGEEDEVLATHAQLKKQFPNLLLVLVPRHPERFDAVVRLCERRGFTVARRSTTTGVVLPPAVDVLVGDTMGELQLFYGACDVAFVGGSLVPAGGHNFLEAAAVGVPAVFGPDMANIEQTAHEAVARGAATQVAHGGRLAEAISGYLADPARRQNAGADGKKLVEENRGALARTLALVEQLLADSR
jgi:3-deoxy-D-manno-octulosonic-acid transferase